jgi:hypothetical protein
MATARRRIIRPTADPPPNPAQERQLQRLRGRLTTESAALKRWWKRLRRAINAVEKHQRAVQTLERQIAQHGDNVNGQDHRAAGLAQR